MSNNTVNVTVSLGTSSSESQSLEYPLVLIPHNLSDNTYDSFSSASGITEFGAATNSPLHKLVSGCFTGYFPPALVKVGRCTLDEITITVNSIPDVGEDCEIYGKVDTVSAALSYTVVTNDTTTEVATGLAAAIEAEYTTGLTVTTSANVITIVPDADIAASFGWKTYDDSTLIPHCTIEDITSDDLTSVLADVESEDDDYFFILISSRESSDIVSIASAAATREVQFIVSSSEDGCKDSGDTSNIASTLNELAYGEVGLIYSSYADTYFPESTLLGSWCSLSAYENYTLNLASLSGIPTETLTDTEITTLYDRNTNVYLKERGYSVFKQSKAMDGNFLDTIRFSKWVSVRVKEVLFDKLRRATLLGKSIPYSDDGARILKQAVYKDVILLGINGGTIATGTSTDEDTGFAINYDPVLDFNSRVNQTNANISNRIWDDVKISLVYTGAIHEINVNIYVELNRSAEI